MSYLDRSSSVEAIKNISSLFSEVSDVYEKHGIDIDRDVGIDFKLDIKITKMDKIRKVLLKKNLRQK